MKRTHRQINRRRLPPFNAIRAFEAVVRLGSMVSAAEELSVTHGAISKQIGALEAYMRRPLLERTPHGVRPTEEGLVFASELRQALDQIHRASRSLLERSEVRPLRVIAPATFAMQWLIPNLRRAADPALQSGLSIHTTQTHESWTKTPFDVAIRRGESDCAGIASEPLFTERLTLIAAPSIAQRLREEGVAAVLDIQLFESQSRPGELTRWLAAAGIEPLTAVSRFSHFYVLLQAIMNDYGAGVGPEQVLADEMAAGRIAAPFPDLVTPGVEYRLLVRDAVNHPLGKKFVDWMRERSALEASL